MSIEVGALVLGIEADDSRALKALRNIDRLSQDVANRQAADQARLQSAMLRYNRTREVLAGRQRQQVNAALGGADAKALAAAQRKVDKAMDANIHAATRLSTLQASTDRSRLTAQRGIEDASDRYYAAEESKSRKQARIEQARFEQQYAWDKRRSAAHDAAIIEDRDRNASLIRDERRRFEQEETWQRRKSALHDQALSEERRRDSYQAQHATRLRRAEIQAYAEDRRRSRFPMSPEMQDQSAYWNRYYRDQARQQRQSAAQARRQQSISNRRSAGAGLGLGALGLSAGFAAAVSVRSIVSMTNEYQRLQQRLSTVTTSQEQANLIFSKLGGVADRARSNLGDMSEMYVKLRNSNEKLGLSQKESLQLTEAFANSLRVSGATGQAASSAMLQFGQAMSKGKLDGDEFRTVAETNAEAMKVFAKYLGVTQGELLKMREEGKLSARDLATALIQDRQRLADLANQAPITMEQGLIQFKNSMLKVLGGSDDVIEAANNIAQAFVKVGKFAEENGAKIIGLGTAAAAIYGVVTAVKVLDGALKMLAAGGMSRVGVLLGGPIGVMLGLAVGVDQYEKGKKSSAETADKQAIQKIETLKQGVASLEVLSKRLNAARKNTAEMRKRYEAAFPDRKGGVDDLLKPSLDEEARLSALIASTGKHMQALKEFNNPAMVTTADAPKGGDGKGAKAAKDDTDAYLSSLVDLHEKEKLRGVDIVRGMDILAAEEELLKSKTASTEDYARALERVEKLRDAGFMTSLDTKQAKGDVLRSYDLNGKPIRDNGRPLKLDTTDTIEKVSYSEVKEEFSHLDIFLGEMREQIGIEFKLIGLELGEGLSGAITTGVTRGLGEGLSAARDAIGGALGSIGAMVTDKGGKLVMKGLGAFFKKVGLSIGIFGKLMLKFQAMAASNPLAMGAVAIGIGLAMSALASKIGGASSGGGGFEGGGIGGLSVGRPSDKAQTYTFGQDRGRMVTSNGAPVAGAQPIVNNFTVIGPNDVRAQTEITKMVRAGMRRGS